MVELIRNLPDEVSLAIAASLILVALSLVFLELYAGKKRKNIAVLRDVIYTDLKSKDLDLMKSKELLVDALAFGVGASTMTLIDLYTSSDNQNQVLDVLEQRFPDALESYDRLDWFHKVQSLHDGEDLGSYISNFKGYQAEILSVDFLEGKGYDQVGLFETLNHPNDDVFGYLNGTRYDFSVKNGSADYIKSEILTNDVSKNYIVNQEAYEVFEANGDLEGFSEKGIEVLNGGFSDIALTHQAEGAFSELLDSGSVVDDIPVIALVLFGFKAVSHYNQYKMNLQSQQEFHANLLVDGGRVMVGGVFGVAGWQIGAALGSVVPGLGTLIGGGIGLVAGVLMGGNLFIHVKDRLKWGRIFDAIDYFGDRYINGFNESMNLMVADKYFDYRELKQWHNDYAGSDKSYEKSLNPYSFKSPSLASVLEFEYADNMNEAFRRMEQTVSHVGEHLVSTCRNITIKSQPKSKAQYSTTFKRILGDVLVSNSWVFGGALTPSEKSLIAGYQENLASAPNHPYRITSNNEQFFDAVVQDCYEGQKGERSTKLGNYGFLLYFTSFLLVLLACSIVFFAKVELPAAKPASVDIGGEIHRADKVDGEVEGPVTIEGSEPQNYPDLLTSDLVAIASSTLSEPIKSGILIHEALRTLDGDPTTVWCEGIDGSGIGEWIEYNAPYEGRVYEFALINGHSRSEKLYGWNDRVKRFRLTFSDGSIEEFSCEDGILEPQTFVLQSPVLTRSIRLTILETYEGSKYADAAIGSFSVNGTD